ncbi:4Fe-4S dicluster domain-containing protein, partial [Propylenella binzhouense]
MQTSFSPAQLADLAIREADAILRKCVHCGFCTATCPTYVELGNELDSPRGRIYLIKDMLEQDRPASSEVALHIDRCLSCLSCMTTCPSGVDYMHLVDQARVRVEETYRRPLGDRLTRSLLAAILPYRGRFRLALAAAFFARPLAPALDAFGGPFRRLAAMLRLAPARFPGRAPATRIHPAAGP